MKPSGQITNSMFTLTSTFSADGFYILQRSSIPTHHFLKFKYVLFWVFLLDNVILCKCIANTFVSVSATLLSTGHLYIILLGLWGLNGARLQSPHARDGLTYSHVLIRIVWISFFRLIRIWINDPRKQITRIMVHERKRWIRPRQGLYFPPFPNFLFHTVEPLLTATSLQPPY